MTATGGETAMEKTIERIQSTTPRPKRVTPRLIVDIALYAAILCILIAAIVVNGEDRRRGFQVFGYSGYTVLGGGMESEFPDGSLLLTQKADPSEIAVGDDITFLGKDDSTVIGRVVEIIEDHRGGNTRGFVTEGSDGGSAGGDAVHSENVTGVVKRAIPGLGNMLVYISENIGMFLLISITVLGNIFISYSLISKKPRKRRGNTNYCVSAAKK